MAGDDARRAVIVEQTLYFTDPSARETNTAALARWAAGYVCRERVRNLIVASSSGRSAIAFLDALGERHGEMNLVVVRLTPEEEKVHGAFDPARLERLRAAGVPVIAGTNALTHNVGWALGGAARAASPSAIIAEAYYRFCPGVKTAVEVALMATDAGAVRQGERAVAVAGADGGADTALLLRCAESLHFRRLVIEKVLARPLAAPGPIVSQ